MEKFFSSFALVANGRKHVKHLCKYLSNILQRLFLMSIKLLTNRVMTVKDDNCTVEKIDYTVLGFLLLECKWHIKHKDLSDCEY